MFRFCAPSTSGRHSGKGRRLAVLFLGGLLLTSCLSTKTAQSTGGAAFIVVDDHTKKVLAHQGANEKRGVASLTKIATALVVIDWADLTQTGTGQYIQVPYSVAGMGGANPLGLQPGDEITIRDALYSAIMASDNVAAESLATWVGTDLLRRQGGGGNAAQAFVREMNNLARTQGCQNTKFTNSHGLDHTGPPGHSTAADMARLTVYAMTKPAFTFKCSQKSRTIAYRRAGQDLRFKIQNTNQLLGQQDIDGVKTGLTNRAGQCLVISAKKQPVLRDMPDGRKVITPRRLVVVVLNSPDRFRQASGLLQQGWAQYDAWVASGRPVLEATELLSGF